MLKARVRKNLTLLMVMFCVGLLNTNCSKMKKIFSKKKPTVNLIPTNDGSDIALIDPDGSDNGEFINGETGSTFDSSVAGGDSDPYSLDSERLTKREELAGLLVDLETIHFDFNSPQIPDSALTMLAKHSEWLQVHSDIVIQIEGHCDERGTVEYNMSLGQQRADVVREYFIIQGIDPERLYALSYGEERPIAMGGDSESYRQNRRVQFLAFANE